MSTPAFTHTNDVGMTEMCIRCKEKICLIRISYPASFLYSNARYLRRFHSKRRFSKAKYPSSSRMSGTRITAARIITNYIGMIPSIKFKPWRCRTNDIQDVRICDCHPYCFRISAGDINEFPVGSLLIFHTAEYTVFYSLHSSVFPSCHDDSDN